MLFNTRVIALASIASTLTNALPLDANQPRNVVVRAKSYSVINVDGGATTGVPAEATTTVQVTNPAATVTAEITATVPQPAPVPASPSFTSSASPSASSSSSSKRTSTSTKPTQTTMSTTATPKPVFVTVTVTTDGGPTEYYDNGMWHTSYRIKSFEAVATPSLSSTPSAVAVEVPVH
ncbi:hypothetical protein E8E13_008813 [Curvularia kusanoi]|uniref:Uncharacterized protein n=1 Tax=Curvularia kusanoi TaxID=90978 RepID=A0A9P4TDX0_CURKU|nr:hypothetical protein E8E13_008813 [Curvularia kusanoi]